MDKSACPVCSGPAQTAPHSHYVATDFRCPLCGEGVIADLALVTTLRQLSVEQRALLSATFRNGGAWERKRIVSSGDIDAAVGRGWPLNVGEQIEALLFRLARTTQRLGGPGEFNFEQDYPLLWAKDASEAAYVASALVDEGLIEGASFAQSAVNSLAFIRQQGRGESPALALTPKGWARLGELRSRPLRSDQAFIAMWFHEETNRIYDDAIAPAVIGAGYRPYRVDKAEHANRIDDEIVSQIRRSRFMIADFTGQCRGVYFEAGMMLGLGRNVIWACREGGLKPLHFDVSHFNFLFYRSPEGLRERLQVRIAAIEGNGPAVARQA